MQPHPQPTARLTQAASRSDLSHLLSVTGNHKITKSAVNGIDCVKLSNELLKVVTKTKRKQLLAMGICEIRYAAQAQRHLIIR